jgi:hypothetical protein
MKYKKIITSGCSFSDAFTPYSWPNQLEAYILKNVDSTVKFDHRGLGSQGQELIQKKASHAIYEALSTGYNPDEIAVFVMWSSVDRKAFYVDNPDMLSEIFENWKGSKQGWALQLADLHNKVEEYVTMRLPDSNDAINYNKTGGWYLSSALVANEMNFIKDYFMTGKNAVTVQMCQESLENIIFLQNSCKAKGIKLYQQWYSDHTRDDLMLYKDHQNIKYLYSELDQSTFISDNSLYNYLLGNIDCFKSRTDSHPNGLGHRRWLNEVILPYLDDDNFFN